jgi:hypothetical protein
MIRPDSRNELDITPPAAGTPGSRFESITTPQAPPSVSTRERAAGQHIDLLFRGKHVTGENRASLGRDDGIASRHGTRGTVAELFLLACEALNSVWHGGQGTGAANMRLLQLRCRAARCLSAMSPALLAVLTLCASMLATGTALAQEVSYTDAELISALESSYWIAVNGPRPKKVYVIASPWCPFCAQLQPCFSKTRPMPSSASS